MDSLGTLLRRYRHRAALSLDALAGSSGVSVRAISNLERGISRRAHPATIDLLCDALRLTTAQRRRLNAALSPGPAATDGDLAPPPAVDDFVGRTAELAAVGDLVRRADVPALVVAGSAGRGKTSLALRAASELAGEFPDGVRFVDLHGTGDRPVRSGQAQASVLRALGVPGRAVPDDPDGRTELYRRTLSGRRALVVFDDAADEAQVRPLLPAEGSSFVLVTSRRVLAGLTGVHRLHLEVFDAGVSARLLHTIAADPATDRAPDDATAEIAELCGHLPLALRIAGELLNRPGWTASGLAEQLRDQRNRLDHLSGVSGAMRLSYRQLSPEAALIFRRLTLIPGTDAGTEPAVLLSGLPVADTEDALDELADLGLLQATADLRYRYHDLVRLFARSQLSPEENELTGRLVDWLLAVATAAGQRFSSDPTETAPAGTAPAGTAPIPEPVPPVDTPEHAEAWLRADGENWLGALRLGGALGRHRAVVDAAEAMHWFSERWTDWGHWQEVFELGRDSAAAIGDRVMRATHTNYLAWVALALRRRPDLARTYAVKALAIAERAGEPVQQAWALKYRANADMLEERFDDAAEAADRARAVFQRTGDAEGLVTALGMLGLIRRNQGRPAEALVHHRSQLRLLEPGGPLSPQVAEVLRPQTVGAVGHALLATGDLPEAIEALREALAGNRRLGAVHVANQTLIHLGKALVRAGRTEEGLAALREAAEFLESRGLPATDVRLSEP